MWGGVKRPSLMALFSPFKIKGKAVKSWQMATIPALHCTTCYSQLTVLLSDLWSTQQSWSQHFMMLPLWCKFVDMAFWVIVLVSFKDYQITAIAQLADGCIYSCLHSYGNSDEKLPRVWTPAEYLLWLLWLDFFFFPKSSGPYVEISPVIFITLGELRWW